MVYTMNEFWEKEWAKCPEADGIDFVPIGWWPWSPGLPVAQSNVKADFENPNFCYPRSGRFFWKWVDGKKQYILQPHMIEYFQKEFCSRCGTQRCPGDAEAIATCGHAERKPKMKKQAYVSVTYLFTFEPSEVGVSEDCTESEFEAAIDGYLNRVFEEVQGAADIIPNDIEVDIKGDFE